MSSRADTVKSGTALISVEPPIAVALQHPAHRHGVSALVAQLFANRDQLPQTRDRRRLEPAQAIAAYQATGTVRSAQPARPRLDIHA